MDGGKRSPKHRSSDLLRKSESDDIGHLESGSEGVSLMDRGA